MADLQLLNGFHSKALIIDENTMIPEGVFVAAVADRPPDSIEYSVGREPTIEELASKLQMEAFAVATVAPKIIIPRSVADKYGIADDAPDFIITEPMEG